MIDIGEVTSAVVPFVSAAVGAYGTAVVQRVVDQAGDATADATVGVGRRVLRRLFLSGRGAQIEDAVADLGTAPADEDLADLVRAQISAALARDPELAAEIAGMLPDRPGVTIVNSRGVQVGDHNTQTNHFGA
ncbi:RIP homotypic interaction motif-containing protein [Dactylosporangium sp. NPDC005555]|uniref:RIP homotypic interaction motif-containing protein n=1 Tax=Dactylosporangium sp. NPDC005555 TaxID=3154889 RepID=UPI0033A778BB